MSEIEMSIRVSGTLIRGSAELHEAAKMLLTRLKGNGTEIERGV